MSLLLNFLRLVSSTFSFFFKTHLGLSRSHEKEINFTTVTFVIHHAYSKVKAEDSSAFFESFENAETSESRYSHVSFR